MFCPNCGTQCADNAAFCANCATPLNNAAAPQPQVQPQMNYNYNQPVQTQPDFNTNYVPEVQPQPEYNTNANTYMPVNQSPKKNNKILIIAIAAIAVVAIVLAVVFLGGGRSGSPEGVAEDFAKASIEADVEAAYECSLLSLEMDFEEYMEYSAEKQDMTLDEFYEELSEEYDEDISSMSDFADCLKNAMAEQLESVYGEYSFKVEVTDKEQLTNGDLKELREDFAEALEDTTIDFIDPEKIEEGYEIEVTITIEGEEQEESDSQDIVVVNYDGDWVVLDDDML